MIDVVQIGKRRNYLVPITLNQLGYLNVLYTDYTAITNVKNRIVFDCLNIKYYDELLNSIDRRKIKNISYGINYYFYRLLARNKYDLDSIHFKAVKLFLKNVYENINLNNNMKSNLIYSYNGASLELYKKIKNKKFIYDMTSLLPLDEYYILEKEYKLYGSIEKEQFTQNIKTVTELHNRQIEEIKYADKILCLSENVADSIKKYINVEQKIHIIHHPVTISLSRKVVNTKIKKILFLGRVSIDKGIHYLLNFIDHNNTDGLMIDAIGPIHIKEEIVLKYKNKINFTGSLSSTEVQAKLQNYDLLVFPSVVGGLGMACYEAMAHGIPVLTTENEVITDNFNGFTFKERDEHSFQNKLNIILSCSQNKLNEISSNAQKLMKNHSSIEYGKKLLNIIIPLINEK